MSGRFAGSKSIDERRRRRLASDDAPSPAAEPVAASDRPLPTRRPTARFPLQRVVARSVWKAVGVGLTVSAVCVGATAAERSPALRAGACGPGLAQLCDAETGRLTAAAAGLLLFVAGQAALLIRWARSRSLRDFRGGYRIWAVVAAACFVASGGVLTGAHAAVAVSLGWWIGVVPPGGVAAYWAAPALAAVLGLVWRLRRETAECPASRALLTMSAAAWSLGLLARLTEDSWPVLPLPAGLLADVGLLAGTAATVTGLLFHARHVVYRSVEPPEPRPAKPKSKAALAVEEAVGEPETDGPAKAARPSAAKAKPKAAAPRRRKTTERPAVEAKAVVAAAAEAEPVAEAECEPAFARPQTANVDAGESATHEPEPIVAERGGDADAAETEEDEASDDGRQLRLDGPENPLKGLSKRERRKLKQAERQRGR